MLIKQKKRLLSVTSQTPDTRGGELRERCLHRLPIEYDQELCFGNKPNNFHEGCLSLVWNPAKKLSVMRLLDKINEGGT